MESKPNKSDNIFTVDVVLHPVQLIPLLADHGGQVHEHCVDLRDLLLQPHHVFMSVGKVVLSDKTILSQMF